MKSRVFHVAVVVVAGCVSRTAVAPLERLKIIFQVQDVVSSQPHKHTSTPKYSGVYQSLQKILAEEGWKGFFKGNGTNCARVFPYTALQFYW